MQSTLVYDKRKSVARTGKLLQAVILCTLSEYLLAIMSDVAMNMR